MTEQEAFDTIIRCMKQVSSIGEDRLHEVTMGTHLREASILDSLDTLSVIFEIEKETGVSLPDRDFQEMGLLTMGNLVAYLVQHAPKDADA